MKIVLSVRQFLSVLLIASVSYLGFVQCWGQFALMRNTHSAVDSAITNKWVKNILFFLLFWFGAMLIVIVFLLDIVIFNLIEFWAGSNPLAIHDYDEKGEHKKVVKKGDETVVFIHKKYGQELEIRLYKRGEFLKTIVAKKNEPGILYTLREGAIVRVDVQMTTAGDSQFVTVREGLTIVGQRKYSKNELTGIMKQHLKLYANLAGDRGGNRL